MNQFAPLPRSALLTWILLLGAILALLVFAQAYGDRKRGREVRLLVFAYSGLPAGQLAHCLASRMPLTGRDWTPVDGAKDLIVRWNTARGMRVTIIDGVGKPRRIEIATIASRSLRKQEAEALRSCLAGK